MGKKKPRPTRVVAARIPEDLYKKYEKRAKDQGLPVSMVFQKALEAQSQNEPENVESWVRGILTAAGVENPDSELLARTLEHYKNVDTNTPIPKPFQKHRLVLEAEKDVRGLMKAARRNPDTDPLFEDCVQERLGELIEIEELEKEYAGLRSQNPTLPSLEKVYAARA